MMLHYCTLGSNDLSKARVFYDALLPIAGGYPVHDRSDGGRIYAGRGGWQLGILPPADGEAASVGNGVMIGFELGTAAEVERFHAVALSLGGSDAGAPGWREGGSIGLFFAYVRDREGNKLCAYARVRRAPGPRDIGEAMTGPPSLPERLASLRQRAIRE